MGARHAAIVAGIALTACSVPALGATTADLVREATTIADGASGKVGFSVSCGRPPRTVGANADMQLRGASSLKAGIAAAYAIARSASGSALTGDTTLRSTLIDSDNGSANDLFTQIGEGSSTIGVEKVNALFGALGMRDTRFDGPYRDTTARSQKVTTANDMRVLAEDLMRLADDGLGPLAQQGATQQQARAILGLMSQSTYPSVFAGVGGATIAHKPGWLDNVQNDLAVITLPGKPPCAAGFVSEGLSLSQAQAVGSSLMSQVVMPLAKTTSTSAASRAASTQTTPTAPEASVTTPATATAPDTVGATVVVAPTGTTTDSVGTSQGEHVVPAPAPAPAWYLDWRLWALAVVVALLIAVVLRSAQMSRRRRRRDKARRRRHH